MQPIQRRINPAIHRNIHIGRKIRLPGPALRIWTLNGAPRRHRGHDPTLQPSGLPPQLSKPNTLLPKRFLIHQRISSSANHTFSLTLMDELCRFACRPWSSAASCSACRRPRPVRPATNPIHQPPSIYNTDRFGHDLYPDRMPDRAPATREHLAPRPAAPPRIASRACRTAPLILHLALLANIFQLYLRNLGSRDRRG